MQSWSLCMIVRDEEEVLERCLKSAAELFDDIVIVDTGSVDATRSIALRFTERVYDLEWCDDFAAARNYAFGKAEGDYIMWLDADDVLPEKTRAILSDVKAAGLRSDVVMLPYETGFDERGRTVFSYRRERIIKNCDRCRWIGAVHEVIVPFGEIEYIDAPVRHMKQKRGGDGRNLRIYEKLIADGARLDARQLYYYGRELAAHGRYGEAEKVFSEVTEREDTWIENRLDAACRLAECKKRLGKDPMGALLSAMRYRAPSAELCCAVGREFYDRGELVSAEFWYTCALGAVMPGEGAFVSEEYRGFMPCIMLCLICYGLGDIKKSFLYNEAAARFRPDSPYCIENRCFFREKHGLSVE